MVRRLTSPSSGIKLEKMTFEQYQKLLQRGFRITQLSPPRLIHSDGYETAEDLENALERAIYKKRQQRPYHSNLDLHITASAPSGANRYMLGGVHFGQEVHDTFVDSPLESFTCAVVYYKVEKPSLKAN